MTMMALYIAHGLHKNVRARTWTWDVVYVCVRLCEWHIPHRKQRKTGRRITRAHTRLVSPPYPTLALLTPCPNPASSPIGPNPLSHPIPAPSSMTYWSGMQRNRQMAEHLLRELHCAATGNAHERASRTCTCRPHVALNSFFSVERKVLSPKRKKSSTHLSSSSNTKPIDRATPLITRSHLPLRNMGHASQRRSLVVPYVASLTS